MKTVSCIIIILLQVTIAISFLCNSSVSDSIRPDASEVKFDLYIETPDNWTRIDPEQVTSITYNSGCPFVFITHGFTDYDTDTWISVMVYEFFKKGCYNIIVVDWAEISSVANYTTDLINFFYPYTAFRTCSSGEYAGQLMVLLNEKLGISYADMSFVGHSLGAHFAGCAGQYVFSKTGQHIARVTGLDPAGPMFYEIPENCRLSPDDADFVDCIHTGRLGAGYATALGDMDFYPNGGAQQPGCQYNTKATMIVACDHFVAVLLYSESINTRGFTSHKCDDYLSYETSLCVTNQEAEMGYNAVKQTPGTYYLDALANAPYAMNGKTRAGSVMSTASSLLSIG